MTDYPAHVPKDKREAWDRLDEDSKDAVDKVLNPDRWVDIPAFNRPLADDPCACCTGDTTAGYDTICGPCKEAIQKQDRSLHPHAPSPAQQALIDAEGMRGGRMEMTLTNLPPGYDIIARIEEGDLDRYLGRIITAAIERRAQLKDRVEHG